MDKKKIRSRQTATTWNLKIEEDEEQEQEVANNSQLSS